MNRMAAVFTVIILSSSICALSSAQAGSVNNSEYWIRTTSSTATIKFKPPVGGRKVSACLFVNRKNRTFWVRARSLGHGKYRCHSNRGTPTYSFK